MTGAAAADAAVEFVYGLEPLDWIVIVAAAVSVVVLVLELRRERAAAAPEEA
jgi:Flp pilus assembly protein TadB